MESITQRGWQRLHVRKAQERPPLATGEVPKSVSAGILLRAGPGNLFGAGLEADDYLHMKPIRRRRRPSEILTITWAGCNYPREFKVPKVVGFSTEIGQENVRERIVDMAPFAGSRHNGRSFKI